ncbi:hypothetical protein WQ54_18935 [Bacillus sp. SA1-12]|nr:hypothetical protein WQ54_18935 [Bacillus sp. SA1-12]
MKNEVPSLKEMFKDYFPIAAADDYTWLNNLPVKGRRNWPFLFDEKHQPKEAFWEVVKTIDR